MKADFQNKLNGISVSQGIAVGNAIVVNSSQMAADFAPFAENKEAELTRLNSAIEKFIDINTQRAEKINKSLGKQQAKIILGHIDMIKDPFMKNKIDDIISKGFSAEKALSDVCDEFIDMFKSSGNDLTYERVSDVEDIKSEILSLLMGKEHITLDSISKGSILVLDELTPSVASQIDPNAVVGIVAQKGSITSHSAILARALAIPTILSAANALEKIKSGDKVIVDAINSNVILFPDNEEILKFEKQKAKLTEQLQELEKYKDIKTVTKDNREILLMANSGSLSDIEKAVSINASGIGLFRTEFLYIDRSALISENEMFEVFKSGAELLGDKPFTIRTLDIGGDKEIPYLNMKKEENPFLGFRAIRYCLKRDDIFIPQLRAILRASAYGKIRIMLPLVTTVDEVLQAKEKIEFVKKMLSKESIAYDKNIKVGVMMETPSAVMIAEKLAEISDFFSIGTNDLTQYIMAVDRGNSDVKNLYSPIHPSVLRAIKHISGCAKENKIEVGMCGEEAANEKLIPLWLNFLDEFSVAPANILKTRMEIAKYRTDDVKCLVNQTLKCDSKEEAEKVLTDFYENSINKLNAGA